MFKLEAKRADGHIISLTQNDYIMITDIQGLEPPTAEFSMSDSVYMDGARVANSRVGTRNIVIYGSILHNTELIRQRLYSFFPVKGEITLMYTSPNREVMISSRVESMSVNAFSRPVSFQISLLCPHPFWEALNDDYAEITNVRGELEFPVEFTASGMEFGVILTQNEVNIYNSGEMDVGMDIYITATGAASGPMVYDTVTGEKFKLNVSMSNGDRIHINTRKAQKAVRIYYAAGGEQNIFNHIDMGSTWLTVRAGDNIYSLYADSGIENLHVAASFRRLYQGV